MEFVPGGVELSHPLHDHPQLLSPHLIDGRITYLGRRLAGGTPLVEKAISVLPP